MKRLLTLCITMLLCFALACCGKTTPSIDESIPLPNTTLAQYTLDGINMKFWLPEGWSFTPDAIDSATEELVFENAYGLTFWPDESPHFRLHLFYYTDYYGICGTGKTFTELTTRSGLTATQSLEQIDDTVWLNIFFHDMPGIYILEGNFPTALWETYQSDLYGILETVVLAEGIIREEEALAIGASHMGDTQQTSITATYFYRDATWSLESGDYLVLLSSTGEVLEVHKGI